MRPSNKYVFENERQQGIRVNGSVELLREESVYIKLVHIFQTGSYFLNQFIFFKLVHIFQAGLKFLNQFNFQF